MPPDDVDEATQKQLHRLRIRGAPAIKPGMAPFVGEYTCKEVQVPAVRALKLAWAEGVNPNRAMVKEAFDKLAAVAEAQKLRTVGDPMWVCLADPYLVEPPKRSYEAVLPMRGAAKEDGDVKVTRVEGGFYITTVTDRGFADLENVYTYLFGRFLPSKSHVLVRPAILHKMLKGDLLEVWVPAGFEMKKRNPAVTEGSGAG